MANPATAITALILAAALPNLARAQTVDREAQADRAAAAHSTFRCQDGQNLSARFASKDARLYAIVDSGDGPHALAIVPWTGGPARMTWSDGRRTLTWSPGVQLMWMDGATHRMCGGGMHHH